MDDLLARAVRNNAEWCARICGLRGWPGQFGYSAWVCDYPAPLYYPNIVTLRPDCLAAQTALVDSLWNISADWGVKDSFHNLDLSAKGFRAAIQGRWVHHRNAPPDASGLEWRAVKSELELASWEAAWGGEAHRGHARIFWADLLSDPTVMIFGGFAAGQLLAGGVVSHAAGVAGLSNTFATRPDLLDGVLRHAHDLADGAPLVGWIRDDDWRTGEGLGPLQVWLRDAPARRSLWR